MRTAVILPCFNEGAAIARVVKDFRQSLPDADIYVFNNNSTDNTVEEAEKAGAIVRFVRRKGKGMVIRRMLADVEADVYIMADGDGTYDAASAPKLVEKLVSENLDMVVGTRIPVEQQETYRPGHVLGNRLLTGTVRMIFGEGFTDMLSGYRVFSRRFVKTFPALAVGFETETELTIHALQMSLPCGEVETPYFERIEGTESKLSTFGDGFRILWFIAVLFKEVKPFIFFGIGAAVLALLSLGLSIPVFAEFFATGLVPRMPTAILCTGLMLAGLLSFSCGIILDSVSRGRREVKRLFYLNYAAPGNGK